MLPNKQHGGRQLDQMVLDLYEAKDQLAPDSFVSQSGKTLRNRQNGSPSDRTFQLVSQRIVRSSGWTKPSIQMGALIFLHYEGSLNLFGRRRLNKLLKTSSLQEILASQNHRVKISRNSRSFGALLFWVQRPIHLKSYNRPEKRRIGVGYRDKGSTPPYRKPKWDKNNEIHMAQAGLYLGENQEYLNDIPVVYFQMFGMNGYPPFHHLGGGWWVPFTFAERAKLLSQMVRQTLLQ